MAGQPKPWAAVQTLAGQRWDAGQVRESRDAIAVETGLALVYNGRPYVVMMVTPQDIEDFVLGFSLSEGIIRDARELSGVRLRGVKDGIEADVRIADVRFRELDRKQRNLAGRLGCGLCGAQTLAQAMRRPGPVANSLHIEPAVLQRAMAALSDKQPLNAATGAVHAAAWMTADGEIVLVREDLGRHNALDKLIGALVREKVDLGSGATLITSRASHEMIQKAAAVGIAIVCAISAPTSQAIVLAREAKLTLVAFARGDRHTVYTHPDRIVQQRECVAV